MKAFYTKRQRYIAVFLSINILFETFFPNGVFALTGGPASPEFSSFEPIATTNMVNEFSGGFTYNVPVINIPGPEGGGYALSLSYHSGASVEEESSWVGYGWTLNPGAINRGKRGVPDDWKGLNVKYWNKTQANKTVSVGSANTVEIYSFSIGANASIRYNNYKGFGYTVGANLGVAGVASLGYNFSDGEGTYTWSINPGALLSKLKKNDEDKKKKQDDLKSQLGTKNAKSLQEKKVVFNNSLSAQGVASSLLGSSNGIFTFTGGGRNTVVSPFTGYNYNVDMSLVLNPVIVQIGPSGSLFGSYNYQANSESYSPGSYGYIYSQNGSGKIMDYYTERAEVYDKQDLFLGLPIHTPDIYSVTGEGLSGGFRAFLDVMGNFSPNTVASYTYNVSNGGSVSLGFDFGGGYSMSFGAQEYKIKNHDVYAPGGFSGPNSNSDEPFFFRFNNDLGGYVSYDGNLELPEMNSNQNLNPKIQTDDFQRSGRSSYIGYSFNSEIDEIVVAPIDTIHFLAYEKDHSVLSKVNRTGVLKDQIGEFSIVNEDGNRYTYGLPVYSRNEQDLSVSIPGSSNIVQDSKVYGTISNPSSKIGEERPDPYATSYLVTSITTPDFIDRTNNGPSEDDFGGYTKFTYKRIHGSKNKTDSIQNWYKWRMPYNGMTYQKNVMSDKTDDLCTYSEGYKEIYYLDSIITKTHFAVFVTSDRTDGIEANRTSSVETDSTARGEKKLKQLDRIELYAKGADGNHLIKTVQFRYNYEAFPGIPNSENFNLTTNNGKLTLKSMWFEYQGVYSAKISPYRFEYTYPTTAYPSPYQGLNISGLTQNPEYDEFNIDPWGSLQANGLDRSSQMKKWKSQEAYPNDFDPAAWQLKAIKLPSGGEIHVQYEEGDYAYVQDQIAHALVSIDATTLETEGTSFTLNVQNDLNIQTNALKQKLADYINDMYGDYKKRMYFKFLYRLMGDQAPTLDNYLSEYLDGYVYVENCVYDGTNVILKIGSPTSNSENFLPREMCKQYVQSQRLGNLSNDGNGGSNNTIFGSNSAITIMDRFMNFMETLQHPENLCLRMEPELSYFRIPMITDKKGGGLRVKRLLMYDDGALTGEPRLFGSEYFYKYYDEALQMWRSSGVATNEPIDNKPENPLVEVLDKNTQSLLNKMVYGRDKEQSEGPIGESYLPSPSVGYKRVITANIHNGKTSPGFNVKEFHTVQDYPLTVTNSILAPRYTYLPLTMGIVNLIVNNVEMEQSYLIKDYNMHGQIKASIDYSGRYYSSPIDGIGKDLIYGLAIGKTEYEYFNADQGVPVIKNLESIKDLSSWDQLPKLPLGMESEIIKESKEISDHGVSVGGEIDVTMGYTPPAVFIGPQFGWSVSGSYTESDIKTAVATKVIKFPVFQKRVITTGNNQKQIVENIAFNPYTGKPMLTSMGDGFNDNKSDTTYDYGNILNLKIPAAFEYDHFGQIAKNERFKTSTIGNTTVFQNSNGYFLSLDSLTDLTQNSDSSLRSNIITGDLLQIKFGAQNVICHVYQAIGNTYQIVPTYYSPSLSSILAGGMVSPDFVKVIRSGRNNRLSTEIGNIVIKDRKVDFENVITGTSNAFNHTGLLALLDDLNTLDTIYVNQNSGLDTVLSNNVPDIMVFDPASNHMITYTVYNIVNDDTTAYCNGVLFESDNNFGTFALTSNGQIAYYSSNNIALPQYIDCFQTSQTNASRLYIHHVISASATTYSDFWPYDTLNVPGYNLYELGIKGKWRAQAAYTYRDKATGVISDTALNYESGLFRLQVFNWLNVLDNNANWLRTTKMNQYSPDGNLLEEENILGIKSTAKYGYHGNVPYLIGKNATANEISFESFENLYLESGQIYFEDHMPAGGLTRVPSTAHSGYYSIYLQNQTTITLKTWTAAQASHLNTKSTVVSMWVKGMTYSTLPKVVLSQGSTALEVNFSKVAQVGEWTLYEMVLNSFAGALNSTDLVELKVINQTSNMLYLDDVKISTSDASAVCYVYDVKSQQLICSFDDQHFGLFYQYNAEGKLIRKQKETIKGLKTLHETQYNTRLVERNPLEL